MNHTNIRFYMTVGFFAFIGILVVWSKLASPSSPQQNNFVQRTTNNNNQQTQAGTTDQDTKNLETTITSKLKNTPIQVDTGTSQLTSTNIGNLLQKVSVTKDQNGAFDVVVNFNIVDSTFGSTAALQQADRIMSAIYVSTYKYNPNSNIGNVDTAVYKYGQDRYGNQSDMLLKSSSLSKSEASNYNWSLDDNSLTYLINKNLNYVQH